MSEGEHPSDAVRALFVMDDHGLFTSFSTAVTGLTVAQAAAIPAPRFNCVWAVVNHVRFWQEVTLLRLRGQPVGRRALGADNGWPPAREPAALRRSCLDTGGGRQGASPGQLPTTLLLKFIPWELAHTCIRLTALTHPP